MSEFISFLSKWKGKQTVLSGQIFFEFQKKAEETWNFLPKEARVYVEFTWKRAPCVSQTTSEIILRKAEWINGLVRKEA